MNWWDRRRASEVWCCRTLGKQNMIITALDKRFCKCNNLLILWNFHALYFDHDHSPPTGSSPNFLLTLPTQLPTPHIHSNVCYSALNNIILLFSGAFVHQQGMGFYAHLPSITLGFWLTTVFTPLMYAIIITVSSYCTIPMVCRTASLKSSSISGLTPPFLHSSHSFKGKGLLKIPNLY